MRQVPLIVLIILAIKLSLSQDPDDFSIEFTDPPDTTTPKIIDGEAISSQSFDPEGT